VPVVRANGVQLAYDGAGEAGPPVVLVHGSWGDRRTWNGVVPFLARSHRVVAYDRRGHGASATPPGQGTREQDAEDLAGLLLALDLAPAHLVGSSFGGSIVLGLAARQPALLRSLAVHEPPVFDVLCDEPESAGAAGAAKGRIAAVVAELATGDMAGGARLFADTVVGGPGSWEAYPPEAQERMIRHAPTFLDENLDPGVFALDLGALAGCDRPALLSYGDTSPIYFVRTIEHVARSLPDARVRIIPGAGHVAHRTHAAQFAEMLAAFVLEVERQRGGMRDA
jgi:pimeloyl-ACP methyl ester carboxylesterase